MIALENLYHSTRRYPYIGTTTILTHSAVSGSSVGTAVTYPLFGLINDVLSWEYIYYMTGVIVTIWYICWTFLIFDTPAKHPRISPEERYYIESALGQSISQSKKKVPIPNASHCLLQFLSSTPLSGCGTINRWLGDQQKTWATQARAPAGSNILCSVRSFISGFTRDL